MALSNDVTRHAHVPIYVEVALDRHRAQVCCFGRGGGRAHGAGHRQLVHARVAGVDARHVGVATHRHLAVGHHRARHAHALADRQALGERGAVPERGVPLQVHVAAVLHLQHDPAVVAEPSDRFRSRLVDVQRRAGAVVLDDDLVRHVRHRLDQRRVAHEKHVALDQQVLRDHHIAVAVRQARVRPREVHVRCVQRLVDHQLLLEVGIAAHVGSAFHQHVAQNASHPPHQQVVAESHVARYGRAVVHVEVAVHRDPAGKRGVTDRRQRTGHGDRAVERGEAADNQVAPDRRVVVERCCAARVQPLLDNDLAEHREVALDRAQLLVKYGRPREENGILVDVHCTTAPTTCLNFFPSFQDAAECPRSRFEPVQSS